MADNLFGISNNPYAALLSAQNADIAPGYENLQTQRQIMAALLGSSMAGGGTQMAGNVAIRTSPLNAVARLLTGYMANKGLSGISEEEQKLMEPLAKVAQAERAAKLQGFQDAEAYRQSLRNAPIFGVQPSPTAGMPSLAPTVANAAALQANQAAAPAAGLPDLETQYTQQAQYWATQAVKSGNPKAMEEAQKFAKLAYDVRTKYSTSPQVVIDPVTNKPTFAQFSETGGPPRVTSGVTPPPDTQVIDLGGTSQVIDKRAVQPGTVFPRTLTPGEKQSNALGWANYGLSKENQNKPQLVTDPNSGATYAVDPRNASAVPVTTTTGEPLSRGPKTLTESQAKAAVYSNMMADASQTLADLSTKGFTGKTVQQQSSIANAGSTGIPYVPGSAAVQRFFSSDEAQRYNQAQLQWTEAALRFQSGATITPEEVRASVRTFFPQTGDSSAVIEQKQNSRKALEESMLLAAGRPTSGQAPQAPPITQPPTPFEIDRELRRRGLLR